jgi:hypothetical protein
MMSDPTRRDELTNEPLTRCHVVVVPGKTGTITATVVCAVAGKVRSKFLSARYDIECGSSVWPMHRPSAVLEKLHTGMSHCVAQVVLLSNGGKSAVGTQAVACTS